MAQQHVDFIERTRLFLSEYAWVIVRNVIGWILVLASPVLGITVPGPGGLPVFLIGFALVTFPGKRKLTARFLRGRRFQIEDRAYAITAAFFSILIPGVALWWLAVQWKYQEEMRHFIETYAPRGSQRVLFVVLAVSVIWLVTRLSLRILNWLLSLLPKFRRKFRPWLKHVGLKLLPPRRKKDVEIPADTDEILELSPRNQERLRTAWHMTQPWIKRVVAVGVTVWIIHKMIGPLRENWPQVRQQIGQLDVWRFVLASALFAAFLMCFRALAWRRVLKGFGYKLPHGPATRIWSVSELARYLPGAVWQVVGRVYLAKPYGVPGSIVTTSQILEVFIFLFANVLVSGACLLWYAQKMDPNARPWLITALALVPTLALLLHPKIFYGFVNLILTRLGKPVIVKRLRGRRLVQLLFWMMAGLVVQSVCVYLIADPVLHFQKQWWWVIAGAYCLAWTAGFLAFWAPAGIGVREFVFVATMQMILPRGVREHFANDGVTLAGLLVLLGFLLRLWTVLGELMLAAFAIAWDWRGAFRKRKDPPDDPPSEPPPAPVEAAAHSGASSS